MTGIELTETRPSTREVWACQAMGRRVAKPDEYAFHRGELDDFEARGGTLRSNPDFLSFLEPLPEERSISMEDLRKELAI